MEAATSLLVSAAAASLVTAGLSGSGSMTEARSGTGSTVPTNAATEPTGTTATVPTTGGEVFCYFGRQQQAFDYFDKLMEAQPSLYAGQNQLKLYSFERESDGQRKFLVASWSRFLDEYLNGSNSHGHFYEIIRERSPCRLYYDLEYAVVSGVSVDGDALTAKFINLVVWKLHEVLGLSVDEDDVIVLDSSSASKFSKHVIITLGLGVGGPERLFKDNIEINKFNDLVFKEICTSTKTSFQNSATYYQRSTVVNPFYEDMFILKSRTDSDTVPIPCKTDVGQQGIRGRVLPTNTACFVDRGVYTRNRAFRLFGCTKHGKCSTLQILPTDKAKYKGLNRFVKRSSSLVKNSRRVLFANALRHSFIVPVDGGESSVTVEVPLNSPFERSALREQGTGGLVIDGASLKPLLAPTSNDSLMNCRNHQVIALGHRGTVSMFPALDQYIGNCDILFCDDKVGELNGWTLLYSGSVHDQLSVNELQCLVASPPSQWPQTLGDDNKTTVQILSCLRLRYSVLNNRYCWNIRRQHKSNGIMVEVNLLKRVAYQICW
jgi:hypothetical protein